MSRTDKGEFAESFYRKLIPEIETIQKLAKEYGIKDIVGISVAADGYVDAHYGGYELMKYGDDGKYRIRTEKTLETAEEIDRKIKEAITA